MIFAAAGNKDCPNRDKSISPIMAAMAPSLLSSEMSAVVLGVVHRFMPRPFDHDSPIPQVGIEGWLPRTFRHLGTPHVALAVAL
jgi:hypothetical protein